MHPDFMTVLWKEWKEILLQRSAGGGGARQPLIVVLIIGILAPLRMAPHQFFSVAPLPIFTLLSAAAISAVIADAFAGERERHTLETLLASRLSDRSILFGKLAACVAYGWMITMACIVIGAITINVKNWNGTILIYQDLASWLGVLLAPPLLGTAVAAAGVFVSLHAATVRQAQQTLSVALVILIFGFIFGLNELPADWRAKLTQALFTWSTTELILAAAGVLLLIDLALIFAAMARFQRSKLVLD